MLIPGSWLSSGDGVFRPIIKADVLGTGDLLLREAFLVDSGADRTVFSADLLDKLGLPTLPVPAGMSLVGISGASPFVAVSTALIFTRADGGSARVNGLFAAFTDPAATDLSILGRDVLDLFDLILSRPRDTVLLLAGNHGYTVQGP